MLPKLGPCLVKRQALWRPGKRASTRLVQSYLNPDIDGLQLRYIPKRYQTSKGTTTNHPFRVFRKAEAATRLLCPHRQAAGGLL